MAPRLVTAMLAVASLAGVATASTQVTWAAVAFVYHGEKIPAMEEGDDNLTPLGANQLVDAGSQIRARYLTPGNGSAFAPIHAMSINDIDNSKIQILSTHDEYVTGSALAFTQGLYPPRNEGTITVDPESVLGNGSLVQFPLNGYQYPNIESLGALDYNSIWIQGHEGCNNYTINTVKIWNSPAFESLNRQHNEFYQSLHDSLFWNFDRSVVNFGQAYYLYEYASYQYVHNRTVFNTVSAADMAKLRNLASQQQWAYNTAGGGYSVQSIAGKTLATKMISQLSHNIASRGNANKLTLLFGSFEPILSFFALANLSSGPASSAFVALPKLGSTMVVELFSYSDYTNAAQNVSTPYPSTANLWVRFLFRNGTDDAEPFVAYPLFGRGNSQTDMSWRDFSTGISDFAIDDVEEWCRACQAVNLFCSAIQNFSANMTILYPGGSSNKKGGISPVIAGVIGATVTLAVFILLFLALVFFGFRVDHRDKQNPTARNSDLGVLKRSGSGGFKGAEKLASDTDLTLKGGAGATVVRHERVGSWELKDGGKSDAGHSSLDKEIGIERAVSTANYGRRSEDDGIGKVNPFGDPVKPIDQV